MQPSRRSFLASVGLVPISLVPAWPKPEPTTLTERERAVLDAVAVLARTSVPDREGVMHACYGDEARAMLAKVHRLCALLASVPLLRRGQAHSRPLPPTKPTEYRRAMWAEPAIVPCGADWLRECALEDAYRRAVRRATESGCVVLGPAPNACWVYGVENPDWRGRRDVAMALVYTLEPLKATPPRDGGWL